MGSVRHTDLANESEQVREAEYLRAKDLFYKFTARDKLANYELERVVLLQNDRIELTFAASLARLLERNMRVSTPDETRMHGTEEDMSWRNWVLSQFNNYAHRLSPSMNVNLVAGA